MAADNNSSKVIKPNKNICLFHGNLLKKIRVGRSEIFYFIFSFYFEMV